MRFSTTLVFLLFALSVCFFCGWITGAKITRSKIADAIRSGRLSVIQRVESIAHQIETGTYLPGERK